ncbi:MAG TPA: hypothetical protein VFO69_13245 [Allosphingosinicella sp.]|nr:hypothetical protein [Allosphingosinicella sp.]
MMALIQYNMVTLIVALLIGIATGWWVFRRRDVRAPDQEQEDESAS